MCSLMISPLASLHEKQRTQIQDMLPQQYCNEKVHIFNVILARNYVCSLMMISDMLSKHVGAVKSVLKKVI